MYYSNINKKFHFFPKSNISLFEKEKIKEGNLLLNLIFCQKCFSIKFSKSF